MFTTSRRNRRRFQPMVDGMPLRIAPTTYTIPPDSVLWDTTVPTSDDSPPPPPSSALDPMPPCSAD
jgi:hypothetical protein